VVKLIKTNKNGIPDLLATRKNECMFIEVKTEKGILSPLQSTRIEEIRSTGTEVKIWTAYGVDFSERQRDKFEF
jgi:Holliday junction resolvase